VEELVPRRLPKVLAVLAAAIVAVCPLCRAADAPAKRAPERKAPAARTAPRDFWNGFLAPTMSKDLAGDDRAFALAQAGPLANPWTRDPAAAAHVGRDAFGALKGAVKNYLVERMDVAAWSLPLLGRRDGGTPSDTAGPGGARVRFGIAHLAPKAEVVVPLVRGRFAFSADVRGRVGTSFETASSHLRIGASLDPLAHDASVGLTARF
jgi:hypothetical protein